jgi:hypothetical protein
MTTTGETLTSNVKAMITGYEELESEEDEDEVKQTTKKKKASLVA